MAVFFILLVLMTESSAQSNYYIFDGIPSLDFRVGEFLVCKQDECLQKVFKAHPRGHDANVAVYNDKYWACFAYKLPNITFLPFMLYRDEFWLSFVPRNENPSLVIFWILNQVS